MGRCRPRACRAWLVGALAFVVVDGDPARRARSALVGANSPLTLLAVYLLFGLVGLYARQSAASGTLGLVGFLVAVLGTMLLAGAWWLEALAVPYAATKAPALVAEPPTGRLLAGAVVSFGASPWAGCCSVSLACERGASRGTPPSCWSSIGGGVGLLIAVVPGAGAPLAVAVAVAWMGTWLLRSDGGGQVELVPPR
jgi:hypothetical protein